MSCPTCDHTMHSVGSQEVPRWWCPRCGTLKTAKIAHADDAVFVPKLVESCRDFSTLLGPSNGGSPHAERWTRLGIAESINRPEDRPS